MGYSNLDVGDTACPNGSVEAFCVMPWQEERFFYMSPVIAIIPNEYVSGIARMLESF